ncbi:unnamed protein product [Sympodiomycopsis kandeliae]
MASNNKSRTPTVDRNVSSQLLRPSSRSSERDRSSPSPSPSAVGTRRVVANSSSSRTLSAPSRPRSSVEGSPTIRPNESSQLLRTPRTRTQSSSNAGHTAPQEHRYSTSTSGSGSTLRPREYRYSIGPSPVRFPKSNTESSLNELASDSQQQQASTSREPLRSPSPTISRPASSSNILTTFPFPHPTTPKGSHEDQHKGFTWISKFFSNRTNDDEDDEDQQQDDIESRHTQYGTMSHPKRQSNNSLSSDPDPSDPYGYRRLAGPQLLPDYHVDHIGPRRRKRRQRDSNSNWITRQKGLTLLFTFLCILALIASGFGWWIARGEDLNGKVPKT